MESESSAWCEGSEIDSLSRTEVVMSYYHEPTVPSGSQGVESDYSSLWRSQSEVLLNHIPPSLGSMNLMQFEASDAPGIPQLPSPSSEVNLSTSRRSEPSYKPGALSLLNSQLSFRAALSHSLNRHVDCVNPEASSQVAASNALVTKILLDRLHRRSRSLNLVNFQNNLAPAKILFRPPLISRGQDGHSSSNESDLSEGAYMVASDEVLICMNVASARDVHEELILYNQETHEVIVLPPLNHSRHPVCIHLISGDATGKAYKVVVAGSGLRDEPEYLSFKTEEYSSTTGEWKCTGDLPGPPFALDHQNGVHYKDPNSENEFIFCVAASDEKGYNKGVLMYDLQKNQWQDSSKRPLPVVKDKIRLHSESSVGVDTNYQLVGCGGSILLVSQLDNGRVTYIHKLFPEKSGRDMWKMIERHQGTLQLQERVPDYPDFIGVPTRAIRSATVVQCGESVMVFSEQEEVKTSYMFINMLTLDSRSGDRQWKEIHRGKIPRYRGPAWTISEVIAVLEYRVEVMDEVKGREHWIHISKRLKEELCINRNFESCEDLYGTLLKRYNKTRKHLLSSNIQRDSSAWDNFWQPNGSDASKDALPKVFNLKCFELMDEIERGKKPRKKTRESIQEHDTDGASTLSSRSLHDPSGQLPMPAPPPAPLASDSVKDLTALFEAEAKRGSRVADRFIEIRRQEIEMMKERNRHMELELELKKIEMEKDKRTRDSVNPRSRKPGKKGRT